MGKLEGYLFSGLAVFCVIVDIIYWYSSHDPTGTTCIALTAGLGGLSGFYLTVTARRTGPRPEDDSNAEISAGAGDLGHFSPGSAWPVLMAFSAALLLGGLVFGLWLSFMAIFMLLYSVVGLTMEHYKHLNAHTEDIIGISPTGIGSGHHG